MSFTSDNILLPDGSETAPGLQRIADTGICHAALRDLAMIFPEPTGVRVADLGCLEGGYAVEFARAGYDTVDIEARQSNIDNCNAVADAVQLPNLKFIHDDVRNLAEYGEFDAVFCCGLLYHLDEPTAFLNLLGKLTRRLLIIQTHYSVTMTDVHEGNRGHWYDEPPSAWSAWENTRSFWIGKLDLLNSMRAAGFTSVFEQYDYLTDISSGVYIDHHHHRAVADRGTFIGVKADEST